MADPVTWTVESQTETTQADPRQGIVRGMSVAFSTSSGVHGTVFVPDAQYNADTVRSLIAAKVAAIAAVGNLSG